MDPALFTRWADRFDLADGPRLLAPGLHLIPDAVSHEQSLAAETAHGLVVMNSCCHAGAAHIVREVRALFPTQKVHAIVGGFHLVGKTGMDSLGVPPEQVRLLSHQLAEELEVERICTGHCTGHPAFDLVAQQKPGRLWYRSIPGPASLFRGVWFFSRLSRLMQVIRRDFRSHLIYIPPIDNCW